MKWPQISNAVCGHTFLTMILLHRIDRHNIGDLSCCPADYFCLDGTRMDIDKPDWDSLQKADTVLIGGGGLFYFQKAMQRVLDLPGRKIGWGIGTNSHGTTAAEYGVGLNKFNLLGLRDDGPGWVPCVSCMSPLFDSPPPPAREVAVYRHHENPTYLYGIDRKMNDVPTMGEAVSWLASAEVVITNTYHGYYWGVLLGRRVVIYKPYSSRFHSVRWKVPVAWDRDELADAIRRAKAYSGALAEAREANRRFHQQLINFMKTS